MSCDESLKMLQRAHGKCALSKTQAYDLEKACAEEKLLPKSRGRFPLYGCPSTPSINENVK